MDYYSNVDIVMIKYTLVNNELSTTIKQLETGSYNIYTKSQFCIR